MEKEVEQVLALIPLDEALANRQQQRAAHRRLFREMVKGELEAGPLSWLRRRALVKFAERLEIDRFEAQLLIRGIEYEGALIPPAAMSSFQAPIDSNAAQRSTASIVRWIVILALIAMNYFLLRHSGTPIQ